MMRTSEDPRAIADAVASLRRFFWPLLIFSIVINVMTLVMPIYMLQIYDRVMTSRNLNTLILLTIVFVGLLAVGSLLTHYRAMMAGRLGTLLYRRLSLPVFDGMLAPSGQGAGPSRALADLDQMREFVAGGNMLRLFDLPWTPLFLAVLFILHPIIGWIAATFAVALLALDWAGSRNVTARNQRYQQAKKTADQALSSSLQASDVVRALGMVKTLGLRWRDKSALALAEQGQAYDARARQDALRRFLQQAAQMAMLGIGAYLAVGNEITAGSIVAGSIICSRALAPLAGSMRAWRHYREVRRAIGDLKTMTPSETTAGQKLALSSGRRLVANALAIGLEEDKQTAIRNLSFALLPGQSLAIVGPSRTGKSLLAQTLVGVLKPAEGTVGLGGVDLHRRTVDGSDAIIGYAPQHPTLFDGTIGENIARFGRPSDNELDRVTALAGLYDPLTRLSQGYDTPILEAARSLTQEQLRFVTLARALYGNPPLLVVDAIDAGLDASWQAVIADVIDAGRMLGQIVIWVTDRVSTVQCLDQIMILTKNGVQCLCPVHELNKQNAPRAGQQGMAVHA